MRMVRINNNRSFLNLQVKNYRIYGYRGLIIDANNSVSDLAREGA